MTSRSIACLLVIVFGTAGIASAEANSSVPPDDDRPPAVAGEEPKVRSEGVRLFPFERAVGDGGVWQAEGPAPALNGGVRNLTPTNSVVGAIHAVATHPTNADIVYIGSVNGGIWKTSNATAANPTWENQTDALASQSIGALELDPTDAMQQTLIAGLGRRSSYGGVGGRQLGVLYTTDGGANWTLQNDPVLDGEQISGVAARGAILLASSRASAGGVFRSVDTGTSWTEVSGAGGSGLPGGGTNYYDLAADPGTPTRFYTVGEGGIFRSDDSGATWTNISSSDATLDAIVTDPSTNNAKLSVGAAGRLFVGVVQNGQPAYVGYTDDPTAMSPTWVEMDLPLFPDGSPGAITDATNAAPIVITSTAHGLSSGSDVFISGVTGNTAANGVHTITVLDANTFELNGSTGNGAYAGGGQWTLFVGVSPRVKPGAQGGLHFSLIADPADPDTVYLGGDRQDDPFPTFIGATNYTAALVRGDAGVAATGSVPSPQWEHLTDRDDIVEVPGGGTASFSAPHADSRDMAFDAAGNLIEVDDGGIYRRSSPADNTGDWSSMIGDLSVTEIHSVAYDTVSDIVFGGTQDNGNMYQSTAGNTVWTVFSQGDGGDVLVDAVSAAPNSLRYGSFQYLLFFARLTFDPSNGLVGFALPSLTVVGGGAPIVGQFTTPLALNAVQPTRILFGGANSLYESLDQGNTISEIGPGIVANFGPGAMAYGGRSGGVGNPDVLYVAEDATVYVRTVAAGPVSPTVATFPGGFVNGIVMDPEDWMIAYVIDDDQVFRTPDAGGSWIDVTGDLTSLIASNPQFTSLTFIPGIVDDAIVVGGRDGVFRSRTSALGSWEALGTGLPIVPVFDLTYDAQDDLLVAGTMGRGAWSLGNVAFNLCPATPATTCTSAGKGKLKIRDATPDSKDLLNFIWRGDVNLTEFADPLSGTSYALCLYGLAGAPRTLAIPAEDASCGSAPCWKSGSSGFGYKDPTLADGGLGLVRLKPGTGGKGLIKVRAKGDLLDESLTLPPALPLSTPATVTVQLIRTDDPSICWEASFTDPFTKNETGQFKAKTP